MNGHHLSTSAQLRNNLGTSLAWARKNTSCNTYQALLEEAIVCDNFLHLSPNIEGFIEPRKASDNQFELYEGKAFTHSSYGRGGLFISIIQKN